MKKAVVYSLIDASTIAKCKPSDLLHFGSRGKLELCVRIPDFMDLRVHEISSNSNFDSSNPIRPDYLAIAQSSCVRIETTGTAFQSDFRRGYFVDGLGDVRPCEPSILGEMYVVPENYRWRTFTKDKQTGLDLSSSHLYIFHDELTKLLNDEIFACGSESGAFMGREYYPLAEAHELTALSTDQILSEASDGRVKLLTGIPENYTVRVDVDGHQSLKPAFYGPMLVALGQESCGMIRDKGAVVINLFPLGYHMTSKGDMQKLTPKFGAPSAVPKALWQVISQDPNENGLEIRSDKLFVLGTDIEYLRSIQSASTQAGTVANKSKAETPDERRIRLVKRKRELINAGHRAFIKKIAEEEGLAESTIKDIIAKGEEIFDGDSSGNRSVQGPWKDLQFGSKNQKPDGSHN